MKKLEIEIVCNELVRFDDKKQTQFNLAMNVISLLFEQFLLLENPMLDKLRIDLFDEPNINSIFEPDKIGKICHVERTFNFDNYDLKPYTQAYDKVKELDYFNKQIHGKLTLSPNKKNKAGIEIEINEQTSIICVLFTDATDNPVQRVELLKTIPHFMFIYQIVHKGKWISQNEYQVSDKSGQIIFLVKLSGEPQKEVVFNPKNKTEQE